MCIVSSFSPKVSEHQLSRFDLKGIMSFLLALLLLLCCHKLNDVPSSHINISLGLECYETYLNPLALKNLFSITTLIILEQVKSLFEGVPMSNAKPIN